MPVTGCRTINQKRNAIVLQRNGRQPESLYLGELTFSLGHTLVYALLATNLS